MSTYLFDNFEYICYSIGYSMNYTVEWLHINPRDMVQNESNRNKFARLYEYRIDRFVMEHADAPWVIDLYESCKTKNLSKLDTLVVDETVAFDALEVNLAKAMYFLDVTNIDLSKDIFLSPPVVSRMKRGFAKISKDRLEEIRNALFSHCAGDPRKELALLKMCSYRVLNRIPKNARIIPRKNYMLYNETQDKI